MKKLITLLFVSLLTLFFICACDSTEVFNKECKQTISTPDLNFKQNINFTYNNKDELLKIEVVNNYISDDLKQIKQSASAYNNTLAKEKYAKIEILNDEDDKYSVKYIFDVTKMDEKALNRYDLQKNWIKLNNKINQSDLTCK